MKKRLPIITVILSAVLLALLVLTISLLSGCRPADKVSYNISKEADYFNIVRRLTVINSRSDAVQFEVIGRMSIQNGSNNELEIIMEVAPGVYKKHFVFINREWTSYVVEDITDSDYQEGTVVDPYHYEINILPENIFPFTFQNDR